MFEFNNEVVNRDGYRFVAKQVNNKFIYNTTDKEEIEVLKKYGFTEIKKTTKKKES